jgi:hypothetical protein
VRRAAAKAIAAIVTSYPDRLNANYPRVGVRRGSLLQVSHGAKTSVNVSKTLML